MQSDIDVVFSVFISVAMGNLPAPSHSARLVMEIAEPQWGLKLSETSSTSIIAATDVRQTESTDT